MDDKNKAGCVSLFVAIVLVLSMMVCDEIIGLPATTTVTGTVVGIQVDNGTQYINFERDDGVVEVFRNDDVWLRGKFDSSDAMAHLQAGIGQRFELEVYGYRWPLLSWYRNIITYRQLSD